jgi:hypothetical protein
MSNKPNTILFSEVCDSTYIQHGVSIISKKKAEGLIKMGLNTHQMYTVTEEFVDEILEQAVLFPEKDKYTADNSGGLLIIIDI